MSVSTLDLKAYDFEMEIILESALEFLSTYRMFRLLFDVNVLVKFTTLSVDGKSSSCPNKIAAYETCLSS